MKEEWRLYPGIDRPHLVSNLGRVKRCACVVKGRFGPLHLEEKILSSKANGRGYVGIVLRLEGRKFKHLRISRMVLEAFVGPPPTDKYQACHNDNNKANNELSNLRWDTPKGNNADKIKHGTHQTGEKHNMAVLTKMQVLEIREKLRSYKKGDVTRLASEYGVSISAISRIKLNQYWRHT